MGGMKDCFLSDGWFASKKATEAAMEVGAELIGTVKTNTEGFCKETKGLAWRFLPRVEEQAYSTRGQAAYCYRLQV